MNRLIRKIRVLVVGSASLSFYAGRVQPSATFLMAMWRRWRARFFPPTTTMMTYQPGYRRQLGADDRGYSWDARVKQHLLFGSLLGAAVLLFSPCSVLATTRTVTNLDDSGAGSLRQAIIDSASGDTINFGVTGTIALTSGALQINHNLTITGPGAANLTITRSSSFLFRIFFFDNGTWNVSGLTISNGHDSSLGGGIYNGNGNLTVASCVISGNTADSGGGGFYNTGFAHTTVQNCNISGNHGGQTGGGIYNNGDLTINDSTFSDNIAGRGGALYSSLVVGVVVAQSTFNNNQAQEGGGIYTSDCGLTLQNCTLSGNTAPLRGGAFLHGGQYLLTVTSCTITGNSSSSGGGINNSTRVNLGNTILSNNSGANLVSGGTSTISSLGYNLSDDNGSGFLHGPGDKINTDPKLDPYGLQNNGGPAQTIALTPASPAIDQGNSFGLTTDQRGSARPVDNPNVPNASDGSDIGAYEAPADPIQSTVTLVVTTTDDHDDGICGVTDCTLREAIQRANALPGPNIIVCAANVTGTITLQTGLGELVISDSTNINGPGARILTISGNEAHRVFNFNGGTSTVSGVTIRDGWNAGSSGGVTRMGGGIYNQATLTLSDCMLTNNFVQGGNNNDGFGGAGGSAFGGGIYNAGTLTLNRCTYSGNIAGGGGGSDNSHVAGHGGAGGDGAGGAVYNAAGATLAVNNSTFNGNSCAGGHGGNSAFSTGGNGGQGNSGAICNLGTMVVSATTIDGNFGTGAFGGTGSHGANGGNGKGIGGVASVAGSSSTLRNTINAGNTGNNGGGGDVDGAFISSGYNLIGIGDFSTGFNASGDQVGTTAAPIDPRLGPLQNNEGTTDTMALMANSPAIDQGKSFGLAIDQRSLTRPVDDPAIANASGGDGSDIGAFELGGTTPATPTPSPTPAAQAINLSTRMRVQTGDNVGIGGFIITGTAPKQVLLRAIGPSLTQFGVPDALSDPVLELHGPGAFVTITDDNWRDDPVQEALILATGISPTNDLESAIHATLAPGAYTAIVRGNGNTSGVALIEVYDLNQAVLAKLANISTRAFVSTGDNIVIGGFLLGGHSGDDRIVVRGIGPSLTAAGVPNALADPTLELRDGNGALLVANNDWQDDPTQAAELTAAGLAPTNNLESGIATTLPPGPYTALLAGLNNGTGVGLVEVYDLGAPP
jgi:CSLREA domain-containing protein